MSTTCHSRWGLMHVPIAVPFGSTISTASFVARAYPCSASRHTAGSSNSARTAGEMATPAIARRVWPASPRSITVATPIGSFVYPHVRLATTLAHVRIDPGRRATQQAQIVPE